MEISLRPYQQEAVSKVVSQFKEYWSFLNTHRVEDILASEELQRELKRLQEAAIVLATGGGKTVIFSAIEIEIRQFLATQGRNLSTLILAHREELLKQARDKYHMIDASQLIGLVGGGTAEYGAPVTVASVATVSRPRHLKSLKDFNYQLVITDEGHHNQADSYQAVYNALPWAFRLYVTATPDRLDGKPIIDQPPVYEMYITDMVKQGFLTNILPILVRTKTDLDQIKTTGGDYNEHELEIAIDNPARNKRIVEAYHEYASGRPFLCFSVTVAHAEHIAEAFREAGIAVEAISGRMTSEERVRTLQAFESGKLQGLVNCGILTEGYDFCPTSCIILARPTKSRALVVQKIGRGLRLAPGKSDCVVLDITDNILNHRLQPVTLSQAIGKDLRNQETLLDMLAREEEEEEKRKASESDDPKERKIKQKQRDKDIVLNILQHFDWKQNDHGVWVVEVGALKHKVALEPSKKQPGLWEVGAKLAPGYKYQRWSKRPLPLDWAQQYAESEALKIQADPGAIRLVDRELPWRKDAPSPEQMAFLDKHHVAYPTDDEGNCTWSRGEASEAIGKKIEQFKKRREAKQKVTA